MDTHLTARTGPTAPPSRPWPEAENPLLQASPEIAPKTHVPLEQNIFITSNHHAIGPPAVRRGPAARREALRDVWSRRARALTCARTHGGRIQRAAAQDARSGGRARPFNADAPRAPCGLVRARAGCAWGRRGACVR
jgi:hypothetical protein